MSLPLGWTEANRRLSFCHVEHLRFDDPQPTASSLNVCGRVHYFAGNRALQIRPMAIAGPDWFEGLAFLVGLFVTAFFVALRLTVLVRPARPGGQAAGSWRQGADDALVSPKGPVGGAGGAAGPGQPPPGDRTAADAFSLARNDIERQLTANERIALQGALGIERTGEWDKPTRQQMAIENDKLALGSVDELTHQLFISLLGRSPVGFTPLQAPSSGLKLHAADTRCGPAASALMDALLYPKRIDPLPTAMDDELRALAVLWRYKSEAAAEPPPTQAARQIPGRAQARISTTSTRPSWRGS